MLLLRFSLFIFLSYHFVLTVLMLSILLESLMLSGVVVVVLLLLLLPGAQDYPVRTVFFFLTATSPRYSHFFRCFSFLKLSESISLATGVPYLVRAHLNLAVQKPIEPVLSMCPPAELSGLDSSVAQGPHILAHLDVACSRQ